MKKYSALLVSGLLATALLAGGCRKYLDINQNPNVTNDVTVSYLLPSTEVTIAATMGVTMQVYGSIWGQYWTQNPNSSQYRQIERYQPVATDFDVAWNNLYAVAGQDLVQLEKIAQQTNQRQYQAIAILLKAYMFQVITDAWGDAPYSQALRGLSEDGGIVLPRYDMQQTIYDSLISSVDRGIALINPAENTPGEDDVIFGGDMDSWLHFANTLKLKMLLRLSEVNPTRAQAGIATLAGAEFLDEGEDAQVSFTTTAGNRSPLYAEILGLSQTQNLVASATVIDSMVSNDDPRVEVFFEPTNSGSYVGIDQGDFSASVAPGTYSIPSAAVGASAQDGASATAPVKFISAAESKFLQAEAVARGWMTGSAATLFAEGISASFTSYGLPNSALTAYTSGAYWAQYPTGGTTANQVRHIITQKWFCMTGNQGFEAWTEWRRTGYPSFFVLSAERLINNFPARMLYPDVEITRNTNFPGTKLITEKVYWDIN